MAGLKDFSRHCRNSRKTLRSKYLVCFGRLDDIHIALRYPAMGEDDKLRLLSDLLIGAKKDIATLCEVQQINKTTARVVLSNAAMFDRAVLDVCSTDKSESEILLKLRTHGGFSGLWRSGFDKAGAEHIETLNSMVSYLGEAVQSTPVPTLASVLDRLRGTHRVAVRSFLTDSAELHRICGQAHLAISTLTDTLSDFGFRPSGRRRSLVFPLSAGCRHCSSRVVGCVSHHPRKRRRKYLSV